MKVLTAVLIVFAVILFFMYSKNSSPVVSHFSVDPTLIQNTITQIQEKNPSLYPVTTVYFNQSGDGYNGRFVFMDSKNYKGTQYDVNVDSSGSVTSVSEGVPASYSNPFGGFVKKFLFGNLNTTPPTPNMQAVWNNYTVTA